MNYYEEIKNKLIDNEIYSRVKDHSKERKRVITYFEIGKILNDAVGKYGDNIIEKYSNRLITEVGKKYNRSTLFRMKQFYNVFKNEKVAPYVRHLSWSHYLELLPLKDENKLIYYLNIAINKNLSRNELRSAIKSNEYERLSEDAKNKLRTSKSLSIKDLVPNPVLIKNTNINGNINERVLKSLIIEDIEVFMKGLGNSFCFVGSEYKIKIGDSYNYIDLLLFNVEYNCYVVIELKVTELKKEHIGQIQVYMNYIDKNLKKIYHDKTIGIIICKRNNKYVIKYCSDSRIISREYELI